MCLGSTLRYERNYLSEDNLKAIKWVNVKGQETYYLEKFKSQIIKCIPFKNKTSPPLPF